MTGRDLFNEGKSEADAIAARPPLPARNQHAIPPFAMAHVRRADDHSTRRRSLADDHLVSIDHVPDDELRELDHKLSKQSILLAEFVHIQIFARVVAPLQQIANMMVAITRRQMYLSHTAPPPQRLLYLSRDTSIP
jgi:hypothetical protein